MRVLLAILLTVYITGATAITRYALTCPTRRPGCSRTTSGWVCSANWELSFCDSCLRRTDGEEGFECTSTCYTPVTEETAPSLVASRAAALLKETLERLSDINLLTHRAPSFALKSGPSPSLQDELSAPVEKTSFCAAAGDRCPEQRVSTASGLTIADRFVPWDCDLQEIFPRDGNTSFLPDKTVPKNPLWCALNLEGTNRWPIKSSLYVQGSSALWKQAVRAAMDHISAFQSGSWSNIFRTGGNGKPRFKIKQQKGNRYVVTLFFRTRYLRQVQTVCT